MVSAAWRAMATRFPWDMDPEASSTRVTFSGVSSGTSGAWKAMRTMCLPGSKGCLKTSLEMANPQSSEGGAVAVVEGVDPLFRSHGFRSHLVTRPGPVEGQAVGGAVRIQAEC